MVVAGTEVVVVVPKVVGVPQGLVTGTIVVVVVTVDEVVVVASQLDLSPCLPAMNVLLPFAPTERVRVRLSMSRKSTCHAQSGSATTHGGDVTLFIDTFTPSDAW